MSSVRSIDIDSPGLTYVNGVTGALAGVFFDQGVGIRNIEVNVWQFYRSWALGAFLYLLIAFRSNYRPLVTIRKDAGAIGGMGLVLAFSGGIYAIKPRPWLTRCSCLPPPRSSPRYSAG